MMKVLVDGEVELVYDKIKRNLSVQMRFKGIKFWAKWFICYMHRNRKITATDYHPVKINLGSGVVVADGWINVDNGLTFFMVDFPNWFLKIPKHFGDRMSEFIERVIQLKERDCSFVHYDLNYGLPFGDGFADSIYCSHLLEHFTRERGIFLLRECTRVLKWGGVLRICVPDLEKYVQLYMRGERIRFLSGFFSDLRGVDEEYGRHRFMYDYNLLHDAMKEAGFKEINRCKYKEGITPDLDVLDSQPEMTLYVEAIKQ